MIPPIKGIQEVPYLTIEQALSEKNIGKNQNIVVVGGGMTGIETAEHYAVRGNRVTIIEMQDCLAPEVNVDSKVTVLKNLKEKQARILLKHKLIELKQGQVIAQNLENGQNVEIEADQIKKNRLSGME